MSPGFASDPETWNPAFNEDIGKGTHAGAANADKMNVFDLIQIDHAVIPPYPHRSWQGFCGNTVRRILLSCFQGPPMHHVQKIGVLQKPFHHVIQSLSRKLLSRITSAAP